MTAEIGGMKQNNEREREREYESKIWKDMEQKMVRNNVTKQQKSVRRSMDDHDNTQDQSKKRMCIIKNGAQHHTRHTILK